ncbi:MAG: peptidoglycan DD-metalloendopeptidase family protein [Chloroflexi bacterium]|nr:peptidoglycan DD-metalloendopeptidase family protein [Chloroflexota bacterium]
MKRTALLTIFLILTGSLLLVMMTLTSLRVQAKTVFNGQPPQSFGGGEWQPPEDNISEKQHTAIQGQIEQNEAQLIGEGKLLPAQTEATVTLSWPLSTAAHLNDFGVHGTSNFVDQNPGFPNALLDYACGRRTYDTYTGYNHPGTDLFTWPFPWSRMDNDEVSVVAAAPGIIVYKEDGYYDRNCGFNTSPGNAVYIRHVDGSIAWYNHLKNGSVTTKPIGSMVAVGEYLGVVGSSGSSTAPHLHLELFSSSGQILDPYAGPCNVLSHNSLWVEQPPYYDTAVNKLTTGTAPPDITYCSTPETSNEATQFDPGDTVYFTAYYRDQRDNNPTLYTIYRPNGSVYQSWMHTISTTYYASSWWWWSYELEPYAPEGNWEFEVIINSQVYTQTFLVGTPPPEPLPSPAVITVTSPNGGEIISPAVQFSVTWQTALTRPLQVDVYREGIFSRTLTITRPISGNGRFLWTIPLTTPTSSGYRIRVSNVMSATIYDESNNDFIIGILDKHTYLPMIQRSIVPDG